MSVIWQNVETFSNLFHSGQNIPLSRSLAKSSPINYEYTYNEVSANDYLPNNKTYEVYAASIPITVTSPGDSTYPKNTTTEATKTTSTKSNEEYKDDELLHIEFNDKYSHSNDHQHGHDQSHGYAPKPTEGHKKKKKGDKNGTKHVSKYDEKRGHKKVHKKKDSHKFFTLKVDQNHGNDKYCEKKGHGHGHGHGHKKSHLKKYIIPMMVGLMTAKAVILPIVIKTLAIISAKGFFLGLLATVMATVLSLKKMWEPVIRVEGKKQGGTTIEVVPVPIQQTYHHHSEYEVIEEPPKKHQSSHHPYKSYY